MLRSTRFIVFATQIKPITESAENVGLRIQSYSRLKCSNQNLVNSKLRTNEVLLKLNLVNSIHTSAALRGEKIDEEDKVVLPFMEFSKVEKKNKKTFTKTIKLFQSNFKKGHSLVDFIRLGLRNMEDYGVHQDLDSYKNLVNILPKGPLVCTNKLMSGMMYQPREQYVILDLLHQMNHYGVIPDVELGKLLESIFGKTSAPCLLYMRNMYWCVKFQKKSPWLLPKQMPSDPFILAKMAIERIMSVDVQSEVTVFRAEDVPESIDKTWIVSGQAPTQRELLKKHSPKTPVVVEGGDVVWLRGKRVSYFVLKADTGPIPYVHPDEVEDLALMQSEYFNPGYKEKYKPPSVHEQDDGIIYGVCATGTSSRDSLLSWVRLLQKHGNPVLGEVPVLFRFKQPTKDIAPFTEAVVAR